MSQSNVDAPAHPGSLVALLARASVTKASVIRITGAGALPALLWFCRHGYDHVGCVRAGQNAPHEDDADAILVAHSCGDLELKRILATARLVRPGGVFIFRLRTGPGSSQVGVDWLLKQYGLSVERRLENGRRALIVARRTEAERRAA